jgi:hypothetical protein
VDVKLQETNAGQEHLKEEMRAGQVKYSSRNDDGQDELPAGENGRPNEKSLRP